MQLYPCGIQFHIDLDILQSVIHEQSRDDYKVGKLCLIYDEFVLHFFKAAVIHCILNRKRLNNIVIM